MWLWLEPQVSNHATLSCEGQRYALADTVARHPAAFPTLPAGSCSADCSCWSSGWAVSTGKPGSRRPGSSCGATEQTYRIRARNTHTLACVKALVVTRQPGSDRGQCPPRQYKKANPSSSHQRAHFRWVCSVSKWAPLLKWKHDGFPLSAKKELSERNIL